ncbi:hypothetical protein [Hoeflea sp.]|uniref:hypothetical protein n=1 Tax=Hoeflea sp. TaxID=1940281 RepID=UPI003A8CA04E
MILNATEKVDLTWWTDPELMAAYVGKTRQTVIGGLQAAGLTRARSGKFPAATERFVDDMAVKALQCDVVEFELWRSDLIARQKPASRAPTELKPHTSIVAAVCLMQRPLSTEKSENGFYREIADFLNADIPRGHRGSRIEAHHVRRADKRWRCLTAQHMVSTSKKMSKRGSRASWWECGFYEIAYGFEQMLGDQDVAGAITRLAIGTNLLDPIHALLSLGSQAHRHPSFQGVSGADLARRIEAKHGLQHCLLYELARKNRA